MLSGITAVFFHQVVSQSINLLSLISVNWSITTTFDPTYAMKLYMGEFIHVVSCEGKGSNEQASSTDVWKLKQYDLQGKEQNEAELKTEVLGSGMTEVTLDGRKCLAIAYRYQ